MNLTPTEIAAIVTDGNTNPHYARALAATVLRVEKAAERIEGRATAATMVTPIYGRDKAEAYLDAHQIIMDAIRGEGE